MAENRGVDSELNFRAILISLAVLAAVTAARLRGDVGRRRMAEEAPDGAGRSSPASSPRRASRASRRDRSCSPIPRRTCAS